MKKTKLFVLGVALLSLLVGCEFVGNFDVSSESSFISENSNETSKGKDSKSRRPLGDSSTIEDDSSNPISSYSPSSSSETPTSSSVSSTSSSIVIPPVDSKWNVNLNLTGVSFRENLRSAMLTKKTKTCSYDSCLGVGAKAAAYPNERSNKFVPFYHSTDTLTTTGSCNREHTWPNSRGTGKSGPGADPFIIRPTLTSDNNKRGNNFYGLNGTSEWDPASCGFTPARGEAARVILYAATLYSNMGLSLSNNPGDDPSKKTMGTLKYLIQWNKTYAPTAIEMQINDYLSSQGYGRNPFVDHPEYADLIWTENGLVGDSGGGGTGHDDQYDFTKGYDLVDALADIDGANLALVSSEDTAGVTYAMTNQIKSSSTPWYVAGSSVVLNDSKTKMLNIDTNTSVSFWRFQKQGDGTYTIYDSSIRKYLYSCISGTYYNINLGPSGNTPESMNWKITQASDNKGFVLCSTVGVYLEFYKGSFQGYKGVPPVPTYLYLQK